MSGIVYGGPVPPGALSFYMRGLPENSEHLLRELFPDRTVQSRKIQLGEITKKNRMAVFRNWDARVPMGQRDVAVTSEMSMLPLGLAMNEGEYERLLRIEEEMGGVSANNARLADALYNDAEEITNSMRNRMEYARGDVLTDGKLSINENGVVQEADFGIPDANFLYPTVAWSDPTANRFTDLMKFVKDYRATHNGRAPKEFITDSDTWADFMLDPGFRDVFSANNGGYVPDIINEDEVRAGLRRFGLPAPKFLYDSTFYTLDGAEVAPFPKGRIALLPGGPIGYTAWGITVTGVELARSAKTDFSWTDVPGIVGIITKGPDMPFRQFTYGDATAMPVLERAADVAIVDTTQVDPR